MFYTSYIIIEKKEKKKKIHHKKNRLQLIVENSAKDILGCLFALSVYI